MNDRPRPDLQALLRFWQPRVRLADWEIRVAYVRAVMMHPQRAGECSADPESKAAFISILDPIDWHNDEPQDIEKTLVHELGHCHLAPMRTEYGSLARLVEENTVEAYARCLVDLHREIPFPPTTQLTLGA